jgi:hypothetical protein
MIPEAKKQAVVAAIEQLEDEFLLDKIKRLLKKNKVPQPIAPPGFAKGNGSFWMSEDFDEPLDDMKEYMY